jgi:PAS domain S-box-containing protein
MTAPDSRGARSNQQSDRMSPRLLKVLMLEDSETDAELIERSLKSAGLAFTAKRVETEPQFAAAIEQFAPDIVLADFKLPSYDGLSAVKYVHSHYPDLPVIVVTGALGDETAVELIKAGASDYVLKDRMARLATAVQRAVSVAGQAARLRKQEAAVHTAEKNLFAIATYSQDAIIMMNEMMVVTFWNKSAEACFGYSAEEAIGRDIYSFLASKEEADAVRREIDAFVKAGGERVSGWTHKLRIKKRDGSVAPLDLSISFIRLEGRWNVIGVVRPQSILF